MRRYECFRRRERFLGVLVFAKLIRISIADILVVSVITRARCKTEPKAPPVDEISNLPVHLGSLLPLNGSVPSLLLSINIGERHTSKQANGRLHTSCISCTKKGHPPGCPSFPYPRSIYLPTASVYPPCAILRPLGFFLTNPASLRSR